MSVKFFSDIIDALGKVTKGLQAIAGLPRAKRDAIRSTLDNTYRLIDTTLNMVIIRLGDISLRTGDVDFLAETARLDNHHEWINAEREFRLCSSLRVTLRETETMAGQLAGSLSTNDWDALLQQMRTILTAEDHVAIFISERFQQLATAARGTAQDPARTQSIRDDLVACRAALAGERQKLIRQEVSLFNSI
jgi:hypothetical protein